MADRDGGTGGDRSVHASEGTLAFQTNGNAGESPVFHGAVPANGPDPAQVNQHLEFFYKVAERFGIPVVLLMVVLWWAKNDLVQPLLDAHFTFINKISDAHDKQVQELSGIGDKLDTLIRISDSK
jgi:hypothetical protein